MWVLLTQIMAWTLDINANLQRNWLAIENVRELLMKEGWPQVRPAEMAMPGFQMWKMNGATRKAILVTHVFLDYCPLSCWPRNPGLTLLCCRSAPVHNCRSRSNCPGSQRRRLSSPCAPPPTCHRRPSSQPWHGLSMYHHPMDLRHSTSMGIGCIVNPRFWIVGNRVAQTIPACTEEDLGLSTMTILIFVNNVLVVVVVDLCQMFDKWWNLRTWSQSMGACSLKVNSLELLTYCWYIRDPLFILGYWNELFFHFIFIFIFINMGACVCCYMYHGSLQ